MKSFDWKEVSKLWKLWITLSKGCSSCVRYFEISWNSLSKEMQFWHRLISSIASEENIWNFTRQDCSLAKTFRVINQDLDTKSNNAQFDWKAQLHLHWRICTLLTFARQLITFREYLCFREFLCFRRNICVFAGGKCATASTTFWSRSTSATASISSLRSWTLSGTALVSPTECFLLFRPENVKVPDP